MYKLTKLLILIMLFIWGHLCSGQTNVKHYIPTVLSPDIGTLSKFIDIPVSHYTGSPDVSIPIHTVRLGKYLTVPITLRYHMSGIKVDELASNVGLGWNLDAGGAIIHSIYGLNDGQQNGWTKNQTNIPQTGLLREDFYENETVNYDAPWYIFNNSVMNGHIDSQPDLFSYSIPGKSGKFFFTQQGKVNFMPFENSKIEFVTSVNGFVSFSIIDDKGIRYSFNTKETIGFERNSGCNGMEYGDSGQSFFLDRIVAPNNDYIEFEYEPYDYTSKIQFSETRANRISGDNGCPVILPCKVEQKEIVHSFRIKSIKSSLGEVVNFSYSTSRADLLGSKALNKIVSQINGQTINTFDFNYGYFLASSLSPDTTLNKRLKLNSLIKNNTEKYTFDYNSLNLPHRLSVQQDHWGYYNGLLNSSAGTLLPVDLNNSFISGANRETDPEAKLASTLQRITYPTGGNTSFYLESNEIYNQFRKTIPEQQGVSFTPLSNEPAVYELNVPNTARSFTASWDISKSIINASVKLEKNGVQIGIYTGKSNGSIDIPQLAAGTYQVKFSYVTDPNDLSSDIFRIGWIFDKLESVAENRLVGGLRIKQVNHDSNDGLPAIIKNYTYKLKGTVNSSGKTLYTPVYIYKRYMPHTSSTQPICVYIQQNSNSLAPLSLLSGGSTVYDYIEEYVSNNREQSGYTSYDYVNEGTVPIDSADLSMDGIKFPFAPKIVNSWLNGVLLKKTEYNYDKSQNKFSPIRIAEYEYKKQIGDGANESFVRGATIGVKTSASYNIFAIDYYYLYSSWFRLLREKETIFSTQGGVENIKEYFYDNPIHGYPNRIKRSSSNTRSLIEMTLFPGDYNVGTVFIDNMTSKNLAAYPIERLKYFEQDNVPKFIQGEVNQYKMGGQGLIDVSYQLETQLPIPITAFKKSNSTLGDPNFVGVNGSFVKDDRYKVNFQFLTYDPYGNLREFRDRSNALTVYLWGYGGQYPVLEIKNTTYAEVSTVLTKAVIDDLNSSSQTETVMETLIKNAATKLRNALPQAMVTSYTYRPLVGMTSKTDTRGIIEYYKYDGIQRLQGILDHLNNVNKSFDYHYRPN